MGTDIQSSTLWVAEDWVTPSALNNFLNDSTILATAISAKTQKSPIGIADEFLINDSGTLKKAVKGDIFSSGSVIQSVTGVYTANAALSVIIPFDDTIPLVAEGTQIISVSITPKYADSTIRLMFSGVFAHSVVSATGIAAVYRDGVAVAATAGYAATITATYPLVLDKPDTPATTSALVYTVRAGPNVAGNIRFNGNNTARLFGGIMSTTLTVQEIRV